MKLSNREKRTVVVGASAALLVALVAWVVLPLWRGWHGLGEELRPALEELARTQAQLDGRGALLARRARLVRQMGRLVPPTKDEEKTANETDSENPEKEPETPASPEAADGGEGSPPRAGFAAELEKCAKTCGVKLKSLVAGKASREAEWQHVRPVVLRMETEAQLDALVKLLHSLETGKRLVRVNELTIRRELDKPGPLQVALEVAAYEPVPQP